MKKTINVEIGTRIRESRERLHMSREYLAELLNISTLFLSYIECGQKGMSTETLIRVCKTLNVSADYILLGRKNSGFDRSEAELLLQDIPEEYYPLAEEHLRLLLKTIAVVQAEESAHPAPQQATRLRITARNGDTKQMEIPSALSDELDQKLSDLASQPSKFLD